MSANDFLSNQIFLAVKALYSIEIDNSSIQLQATRKEFEGDLPLVAFPLLKISHKSPEATSTEIGEYLAANCPQVAAFNVVKGFLNIKFSTAYWGGIFSEILASTDWGQHPAHGRTVMLEFSSPNTNKPLHLGHVRNILLGWSLSQLLQAAGNNVVKVNLVNDRGIHICKSMLAWLKKGNGATPESTGKKGDHLVGDYYVEFNNMLTAETKQIMEADSSIDKDEAQKMASCQKEAQNMLLKWEQGDPEVVSLWKQMNSWVYDGFDKTYEALGVGFDKIYYESQTYLLGKSLVNMG